MLPIRRADLPSVAWDNYVANQPDGWFFHTQAWIEYALAYTPSARDSSFAVADDSGEIVGVAPIVIDKSAGYVFGGQDLVSPLGKARWGEGSVIFNGRPRRSDDVEDGTFVVDLSRHPKMLWRNLRGSYKPLINKASRELTFTTAFARSHSETRAELFMAAALAVHTKVSGRQTRPDRTWQLQSQWLSDGRAAAVLASRNGDVIAFAYALTWKGWAYYFSSASLEDNVLHALVWELMTLSAASGCRSFELGHNADENATEKEKGIAFFKSGFGGDLWGVPRA